MASRRRRPQPILPLRSPQDQQKTDSGVSPDSTTSSNTSLQELEGYWQLAGKTERQDEAGRLHFGADEATLQYGSTILYLQPLSCEHSFGQKKFSFEVIDTCSSNSDLSDDTADNVYNYGDAEFNGGDDSPGTFDLYLTADGCVEGEASAAITSGADDLCYKFKGWRAPEEHQTEKHKTAS